MRVPPRPRLKGLAGQVVSQREFSSHGRESISRHVKTALRSTLADIYPGKLGKGLLLSLFSRY